VDDVWRTVRRSGVFVLFEKHGTRLARWKLRSNRSRRIRRGWVHDHGSQQSVEYSQGWPSCRHWPAGLAPAPGGGSFVPGGTASANRPPRNSRIRISVFALTLTLVKKTSFSPAPGLGPGHCTAVIWYFPGLTPKTMSLPDGISPFSQSRCFPPKSCGLSAALTMIDEGMREWSLLAREGALQKSQLGRIRRCQ
jgi:hypothetical protein